MDENTNELLALHAAHQAARAMLCPPDVPTQIEATRLIEEALYAGGDPLGIIAICGPSVCTH